MPFFSMIFTPFFLGMEKTKKVLQLCLSPDSSDKVSILLFAQFLSLMIAIAASSNEELGRECDIVAATTQQGFVYLMLTSYLILLIYRQRKLSTSDDEEGPKAGLIYGSIKRHSFPGTNLKLHAPIWIYFIIALLDLEANYLTITAFRYTSITSVSLLDALTIPAAMISSRFLLARKYQSRHLFGVAICIGGLVLITYSDLEYGTTGSEDNTDDNDYENPESFRGDLLAIIGAILYGTNNTLTEYFVRKVDREEYLGMIGFCGLILAVIQASITERNDIYKFFTPDHDCHHEYAVLLWISYVLAAFLFVTGASRFLKISEAALMNLSLLTSDLYAVLFSVFAEGVIPSEFYFLALFCIVLGVYVYETAPSPIGRLDSEQIEAQDEASQNNEDLPQNSAGVSVGNGGPSTVGLPPAPSVTIQKVELEIT
mmetsp:Transcript_10533/g.15657  ORF Transcript_10533/g.15657 Transcript_10533/m.15657 type:complete len:428 (+) Transcript_10533:302-1585(+)|eukprot:CAMPEP_0196809280 /NCGR_PEP_ID=MMETSP1362-20130617/9230_1 /TAXON_ID=163516 /ORGANISM="Leptocylindrus danicus, Strain CCMP1856" /LENGTH=427 /DNA_ID=CAMNT_0042183915 /DNA_START=263 /DNA_END=1546 /DNA_ORIENTATION=+